MHRGRRLVAAWLGVLVLGCASMRTGARIPECPGPLPPVASLGPDFHGRQQVRVTADGTDRALEIVLEKRGDVLVIVGFDALGGKRVAITQRGSGAVEIDDFGRPAPIPPGNLLRDLHRARAALRGHGSQERDVTVSRSDGDPAEPARVAIDHADCGYRVTFVVVQEASP